jgi:hypothetical protein
MVDTPSPDWPTQVADTVERLVGTVRDNATSRALVVIRIIGFGAMLTVLGTTALVLFAIMAVRFVDSYLPGKVWAAHLIVGAVFTLGGAVAFARRHAPAQP